MKNKNVAQQILENLGGTENIIEYNHCATRLRFSLKNSNAELKERVENISGVISVVDGRGQFQIVIGPAVNDVYQELTKLMPNFKDGEKSNQTIVGKIMEFISGSFSPILPVITAGGMIQVLLIVGSTIGFLNAESESYLVINQLSQAAFYFLPVFLGYTSSKMLGVDPFLGMMLGGALILPELSAMIGSDAGIALFGFTLKPIVYSSSVLPILMGVWLMSYIYSYSNKIIPDALKFVLVPLISIIVVFPITIILLGPIGFTLGEYLARGLEFLSNNLGWASVMVMGGLSPLLVMGGMHYALFPMLITSMSTQGFDMLVVPGMLAANMAQAGAAMAVALKTKEIKRKQLALSSSVTALMGVTEPALYGINLPLKRPLYAALIGGAAGGLVAGIGGLKSYALISSVAALPSYLTSNQNFFVAILTVVIGFTVAFALSYLFYDEKKIESKKKKPSEIVKVGIRSVEINNVNDGEIISLEQVDDSAFSSLALGKGFAVKPQSNLITSPVKGVVTVLFPSKHAIGITTKEGVQVLIHIGIDTVQLEGKWFTTFIAEGDEVEVGEKLVEVDFNSIEKAGYDTVTCVVVTNTMDFLDVIPQKNSQVPAIVVI